MMNLENTGKHVPISAQMRACDQLSVNVESTNRVDFCGLRRKIAVRKANGLAHGWKTNRPATGRQSSAGLTNDEVTSNGF